MPGGETTRHSTSFESCVPDLGDQFREASVHIRHTLTNEESGNLDMDHNLTVDNEADAEDARRERDYERGLAGTDFDKRPRDIEGVGGLGCCGARGEEVFLQRRDPGEQEPFGGAGQERRGPVLYVAAPVSYDASNGVKTRWHNTQHYRELPNVDTEIVCEATMPQKFDGITWGIIGVEDFLRKYMTPLTDETSMVEDIQTRTATLLDRVKQDIKTETTEDTKTMAFKVHI
ncbi:hypothetical protein B0H14DRAFT_3680855 [Mycena olivaceomarginata]|nr:hypothetical protein B0H14DRAFT_3680855 [Mycena olivaceomarginata]